MSDRISIVAEPRSVTGKKVKQLRRDGWIPAVVYGQRDPLHVQLENSALRRALRKAGTSQLMDLALGGKTYTVLAREIQQHVTRGDLIHVDFMEVDMKVTVTTEAALVGVNKVAPDLEGAGVATMPLHAVEIEALPDDLVSEIEVDMSAIQTIDDVIYVGDLKAPKGVQILTDPETVVVRFQIMTEEPEEEEEEELFMPAADAVEVIGREEDEEFEEGE